MNKIAEVLCAGHLQAVVEVAEIVQMQIIIVTLDLVRLFVILLIADQEYVVEFQIG